MTSDAFSNFAQAFLMGITVVRELHFWITFGPTLNIFIFTLKPASQPASQHPQPPLRGQALANDQQSKASFFLASWPVLSKVRAGEWQLLSGPVGRAAVAD